LFIPGLFLAISVLSASAEDPDSQALPIYKTFRNELLSCFDYEDYLTINRRYASKERLAKIDSAAEKKLTEVERSKKFYAAKSNFFEVGSMQIMDANNSDNIAQISYENKYMPDFHGEVTLVKEDGVWKVQNDSLFPW